MSATTTKVNAASNSTAAIYLFNRDLRWQDNECLAAATSAHKVVYPIFILTPEQVRKNIYANVRSVDFMCRSLAELAKDIPICIFEGATNEILRELCIANKIAAIYNNFDVSPYAVARSKKIELLCKGLKIKLVQGRDIFFGRHADLLKENGTPYVKYTPFYRAALVDILKEQPVKIQRFTNLHQINTTQNIKLLKKYMADAGTDTAIFIPGRKAAIATLARFCATKSNYSIERDIPIKASTSHLSAYLHFGILGPVEVATMLRAKYPHWRALVKQLIWREFYLYIIWHIHTDYSKHSRTISRNNKIKWKTSSAYYSRWCEGETGCPWIDAGMRELNATGYMQNRLRMNVAMFLIFYLQLDWRLGEKYFAQTLYDYDYCQNVCNWMWCASWEQFSNPYFRVFAMHRQMKRFDPTAEYVKRWVPELNDVPVHDLIEWDKNYKKYPNIEYPTPIIKDLDSARQAGIKRFS